MNVGIYFTSDWHIGHEKVMEYSKRPFKDIHHMHRVLINNYNSTVGKNDVCYFIGDMGMHNGSDMKKVLKQLNGTKILILGNHDKKGRQYWYSCGFSAVMYSASIRVGHHTVTMSHCPLYGVYREDTTKMRGYDPKNHQNWHGEHKNFAKGFSLPDWGQFHLHGHIHSYPGNGKSETVLDRQRDIGVDGNNYKPVNISMIESWIAKYGRKHGKNL